MATSPSTSVTAAAGTDLNIYIHLSRHAYIHMYDLHLCHELSHGDEPLYFAHHHSGHRPIYLYPSLSLYVNYMFLYMSHLHLSHELSHGDEPLLFGDRRGGHRSIYLCPSLSIYVNYIYICMTCIFATSCPTATSHSISVTATAGTDLHISLHISPYM